MKVRPQHILQVCIVSLLFGASSCALAADYSVAPRIIDRNVEARDIISETITLHNPTAQHIRVYPMVNAISVAEDGAIEVFQQAVEVNRANTITSWLEVSRGRIELAPGEYHEVPVTIRMNPEVEQGEYHALISFASASNKSKAQKIVLAGQAPGTVVRLAIGAQAEARLELDKFLVDRFVVDQSSGEATYTVLNTGDAEATPAGEIIFYNTRGEEVGAVDLNLDQTTVAAKETATFVASIPEELKMGKYKAFLSLQYGELNTASLQDTNFFYVMPIVPMLIIFGSVLLIGIVLVVYIHRRLAPVGYDDEPQAVAMYRTHEPSPEMHHDIDLTKQK